MSLSFIFNFFCINISSFIFIVPFVLGAFCHLFTKHILDWTIYCYRKMKGCNHSINLLESSATSNNMKLVYWPLMSERYSEEGTVRGPSPPRLLLAVPNVTSHPSVASVPIAVLLYNGPLLCGFNVPIKG